jgi:hypothetical protein
VHRGCRCVGMPLRRVPRPTTMPRRFPPPWSVEETDACYIVRDANGQALAYVYFEEEPGRLAAAHLSPATRRGGSLSTSPSCRGCWRAERFC